MSCSKKWWGNTKPSGTIGKLAGRVVPNRRTPLEVGQSYGVGLLGTLAKLVKGWCQTVKHHRALSGIIGQYRKCETIEYNREISGSKKYRGNVGPSDTIGMLAGGVLSDHQTPLEVCQSCGAKPFGTIDMLAEGVVPGYRTPLSTIRHYWALLRALAHWCIG
ncbi:hypothetical protein GOBAR_DD11854 [Gossypium barbadense]|nr:hypothetical protein GOBAR_DD11854 [Gossypium barbadense]